MRWRVAFVALWYFLASSVALGSEFGSIYNNLDGLCNGA